MEPGRSLEVPVALAEVEGVELGGSLEVPVALTEVEGAEPGGALWWWLCSAAHVVASPLVSGDVVEWPQ